MYIYLASPYSHPDPSIRKLRYELTARACAYMIHRGMAVFSTIVHNHPLVEQDFLNQDHTSAAHWKDYNLPFIKMAREMWVLQLWGWQESAGIKWEMEQADAFRLPVQFTTPGHVGLASPSNYRERP